MSDLHSNVRRGLIWSTINSLLLRLGSLLTGIVLARLLAPEDFGVYAIALTVQSVLLTLVDLGMSVDLVRAKDPKGRAPTVATVSVGSGVLLAGLMVATAQPVAAALGAAEASGVIMVLALTLLISSAGVVPYAMLQREFKQRQLFACSVTDFAVGTSITIALVALGVGPMALAIGRVAAQIVSTSLQFVLARVRLRFGFDREVARSAIQYGAPLAGANLLSWALLNVDNVAIARVAGTTALGFYVLAFNISSWPMSAIGQAIRGVSLAGFSQSEREERQGTLAPALSLTWAAALPVGVLLAALSAPLIALLYGGKWAAAGPVLAALGIFGALRVALDLMATFLMAKGAARPVLWVQLVWFVSLIPAVVVGARWHGIAGAGWAHLLVSIAVVLPAYLIALRRVGESIGALTRALCRPVLSAALTWWAAHTVVGAVDAALPALVLGGATGTLVYAALNWRWIRRLELARQPSGRAGMPAHTASAGMERVTTAPMPTTAPAPIERFSRISAPEPM